MRLVAGVPWWLTSTAAVVSAQPEDHLKTSVATLVTAIGEALGMHVEAVPEARVDDVGGRPHFDGKRPP